MEADERVWVQSEVDGNFDGIGRDGVECEGIDRDGVDCDCCFSNAHAHVPSDTRGAHAF